MELMVWACLLSSPINFPCCFRFRRCGCDIADGSARTVPSRSICSIATMGITWRGRLVPVPTLIAGNSPRWIIAQIAQRMGTPGFEFESAKDIFNELCSLSPIYAGLDYDRIDSGELHWPVPDHDHPGTPVLHEGVFLNGKGKLQLLDYVPPSENPDDEYPFYLTTGRRLPTYHTNTMTGRSEGFRILVPNEWLEIPPRDAEKLGFEDGDWARISSRRGDVTTRVAITRTSPSGTVFMSFAFPEETLTNKITNPDVDPITETPEFKACAVKVEKLGVS